MIKERKKSQQYKELIVEESAQFYSSHYTTPDFEKFILSVKHIPHIRWVFKEASKDVFEYISYQGNTIRYLTERSWVLNQLLEKYVQAQWEREMALLPPHYSPFLEKIASVQDILVEIMRKSKGSIGSIMSLFYTCKILYNKIPLISQKFPCTKLDLMRFRYINQLL